MRVYIHQINTATDRNLLPLAAGLIAAQVKQDPEIGPQVEVQIEILRDEPKGAARRYQAPDVIAFSCYMWNLRHSLELARLAKSMFPDALIVVGGPSIPRRFASLKALFSSHPFIDVAVQGEGEITFTEILRAKLNGRGYGDVLGLAYRVPGSDDGFKLNAPRPRISKLDSLSSPYLDGTFDALMERYRNVFTGTIWESNRGCPFCCTFCDWGQATQSKISMFGMGRVERELNWIAQNRIYYIYAADANFGIKERDADIARLLGRLKAETGFPGYFMINWTKNSQRKTIDIVDILRSGGIDTQVTLSMQSFGEQALKAVKRANIHLSTFRALKHEYNLRDLPTYTELLLGLPGETYNSFADGVINAISPYHNDHFNIYLARVLENAELAEEATRVQYGLQTRMCRVGMARRMNDDSVILEEEEVIVGTSSMPVIDWQRAYTFGYATSLLYNLRVYHVVIHYLRYDLNVDLRDYLEFLFFGAFEGSCILPAMLSRFSQFQRAILKGENTVFVCDGFGGRKWEPHENCFLFLHLNGEGLYDELLVLTKRFLDENSHVYDAELLDELFVFQRCLSPITRGNGASVCFDNNWYDYYEGMHRGGENKLLRDGICLLFEPDPDFDLPPDEYAVRKLSLANSKSLALDGVVRQQ